MCSSGLFLSLSLSLSVYLPRLCPPHSPICRAGSTMSRSPNVLAARASTMEEETATLAAWNWLDWLKRPPQQPATRQQPTVHGLSLVRCCQVFGGVRGRELFARQLRRKRVRHLKTAPSGTRSVFDDLSD